MRMHEKERDSLARQISPTLAIILPVGPVLDALSKNICHTSSPEVILASITSFATYSFEVSETGWAARKSARTSHLIDFWEQKSCHIETS